MTYTPPVSLEPCIKRLCFISSLNLIIFCNWTVTSKVFWNWWKWFTKRAYFPWGFLHELAQYLCCFSNRNVFIHFKEEQMHEVGRWQTNISSPSERKVLIQLQLPRQSHCMKNLKLFLIFLCISKLLVELLSYKKKLYYFNFPI